MSENDFESKQEDASLKPQEESSNAAATCPNCGTQGEAPQANTVPQCLTQNANSDNCSYVAQLNKMNLILMVIFASLSIFGDLLHFLFWCADATDAIPYLILRFMLGIAGLVMFVLWIINFIKFFYALWLPYESTLKDVNAKQMVGFSFIPFFNLYWNFRSIYGLAQTMNEKSGSKINVGLAMTLCILFCCSVLELIPFIGQLLFIATTLIFLLVFSQFAQAYIESNKQK